MTAKIAIDSKHILLYIYIREHTHGMDGNHSIAQRIVCVGSYMKSILNGQTTIPFTEESRVEILIKNDRERTNDIDRTEKERERETKDENLVPDHSEERICVYLFIYIFFIFPSRYF